MKKSIVTLGIAAVAAGAAALVLSPAIAVSVLALPFLYGGGKTLYNWGKKFNKFSSTTTQQTAPQPNSKVEQNKGAKQEAQQTQPKPVEKPKVAEKQHRHEPAPAAPLQKTLFPAGAHDEFEKKYNELRSIAYEQATGKGLRTNIKWLYDSFQEVLPLWEMRNKNLPGAPGSGRNRKALEDELFDSFAKDASKPLSYYELETLRDRLWEVTVPMAENQVQRARR